jgi:hypothetical protein
VKLKHLAIILIVLFPVGCNKQTLYFEEAPQPDKKAFRTLFRELLIGRPSRSEGAIRAFNPRRSASNSADWQIATQI